MPKSPESQNHGEANNKISRFGLKFRLAVAFILGIVVGGITVDKCSGDDADQPKKPGIADKGGAQGGEGGPDDDKPWPPNLVSEICFDKNPLNYVDVDQCRDLLFKVTGDPNCKPALDDKEVLGRAKQIETEMRMAAAEDIINQFCVSNPDDQKAIRDACLEGNTKFVRLIKRNGQWVMELEGGKFIGEWIELKEKPFCRPPLTTEEEEYLEENKQRKEKIKKFKKGGFAEALDDVNIDDIRYEIHRENLGQDLEGIMEWAQKLKDLTPDSTQLERIQLGCKFLSFVFNLTEGGGLTPEAEERIDNNPVIHEFIEQLAEFGELLLESSGVDDFEECLLHIYGTSSQ